MPESTDDVLIDKRDRLIVEWGRQGMSQRSVVKRLKALPEFIPISVSAHTVRRIFKANKLSRYKAPDKQKIAKQKQQIQDLVDQGLCAETVRKKLNMSTHVFRSRVTAMKISVRPGSVDERDGLPPEINDVITAWYLDDLMTAEQIADQIKTVYVVKRSPHWVTKRLKQLKVLRSQSEAARIAALTGRKTHWNKHDVPDTVKDKIVDFYQQGYGSTHICRELFKDGVTDAVVGRVLRERGVRKRTIKEAIYASPIGASVDVPDHQQQKIVQEYVVGHVIRVISQQHGLTDHVVTRILENHNVERRSPREAAKCRSKRLKASRRGRKLSTVSDRITDEFDDIKRSLHTLYKKYHANKHNYGMDREEFISRAISSIPEVASRWKPPKDGRDNFIWFVARYSLLAAMDGFRPRAGQNDQQTISLAAEMSDGFQVKDLVTSCRERPPHEKVDWDDLKAVLTCQASILVARGSLHPGCRDLLTEYYFPVIDTGVPRMTYSDIAIKHGISTGRVSQLRIHPAMIDLLRDLGNDAQPSAT